MKSIFLLSPKTKVGISNIIVYLCLRFKLNEGNSWKPFLLVILIAGSQLPSSNVIDSFITIFSVKVIYWSMLFSARSASESPDVSLLLSLFLRAWLTFHAVQALVKQEAAARPMLRVQAHKGSPGSSPPWAQRLRSVKISRYPYAGIFFQLFNSAIMAL